MLDWKEWVSGFKATHRGVDIFIHKTTLGYMHDGIDFTGPYALQEAKKYAESKNSY